MHLTEDGFHSVGIKAHLTPPAELLVVHLMGDQRRTHEGRAKAASLMDVQDADLAGSRDAPHVSTLPPDVALLAVEEAVPLLQELQQTPALGLRVG